MLLMIMKVSRSLLFASLLVLSASSLLPEKSQLVLRVKAKSAPASTVIFDPPRTFKYYTYDGIVNLVNQLNEAYPDLVEVTNAQDAYSLPSPGMCGSKPCKQWIVRITNESTLPEPERPEVFFSGALHGNERPGVNAVVELMNVLLKGYGKNAWIRRLVDTRTIYIMPMTNALGYYQDTREENHIDPNRDFAIDQYPSECMKTITARAVNELWREHLFQIAITFHAGMRSIAYEWGTTNHKRHYVSPDDASQRAIGSVMSSYAGSFTGRYPHGPINSQVYPVKGGMEDWGYAGSGYSWEPSAGVRCDPATFGGYDRSKTTYTDDQLRVLNILVETTDNKHPAESQLGSTKEILKPDGEGDGELPRNVRLALFATEIVQPYIAFGDSLDARSTIATSDAKFSATYEVGGAIWVDETYLVWGKWPSDGFAPSGRYANGKDEIVSSGGALEIMGTSEKRGGATRWAGGCGKKKSPPGKASLNWAVKGGDGDICPGMEDREAYPFVPAWSANVDFAEDGEYFLIVVASVDHAWGSKGGNPEPDIPPQSHIANARTNAEWKRENNGHKIIGRLRWYSQPLRVAFKATSTPGTKPTLAPTKRPIAPSEKSVASPTMSPAAIKPVRTSQPTTKPSSQNSAPKAAVVVFLGVGLGLGFVMWLRRRRAAHYARVDDPGIGDEEYEIRQLDKQTETKMVIV